MPKTAKVTAEFDTSTGKFETGINRVIRKAKESKDAIDILAHSAQILGGTFNAISWGYDKFQALSGNIIKVNSDFETLKTSLTGLISVSHSNTDSLGRLMSVQEKWALSTKKADDTLQTLNKIASKTSFNLDQAAQMFKSFYSTAGSSMSLDQSLQAFEGLANMASVVGINIDQMIRTLDGVGAGKWTSSELTRFLEGNLGLTKEMAQEAIKSGKYYDLLIEKTAEFAKMADATGNTFEAVTEAFKSEIENLIRSLTGGVFESFKDGLREATKFLKENKEAIIGLADTATMLIKHLGALAVAYYGVQKAMSLWHKLASMPIATAPITKYTMLLGYMGEGIDKVKRSFKSLKAALISFWPTAAIFAASEAIYYFVGKIDDAKDSAKDLNKVLGKTSEELLKLTQNERDYENLKITKQLNEANLELIKLQKELKKAQTVYDVVFNGSGVGEEGQIVSFVDTSKQTDKVIELRSKIDDAQKSINELSNAQYNLKLASLQASNGQSELAQKAKEAADIYEAAKEKFGKTTILPDLQSELSQAKNILNELKRGGKDEILIQKGEKYIAELQDRIKNFSKSGIKDLSSLNSAYLEISRIGMSEYEKKLDDIDQKYKKWIEEGINKNVAVEAKNRLINETQAAEASRLLKAKAEVYKEYYEKIGDYAKLWELRRADVEKKLKDAGLSGEEYQKILGFSKDAFVKDAQERARQERIKDINEELRLRDREFSLQKRRTELITDETARRIELIEIERAHALEQYDAMLKKGEINKEYYDKAVALENALHQQQIFDASTWGQIMHSGLNSLENAMGNFFDYSSDRFMKFGDLAQDILGQIYKQIVKMTITQPLINSVTDMLPGFGTATPKHQALPAGGFASVLNATPAAQGGVFSSPDLHQYANSIVSKPTFFKFAKGGIPDIGVMGEKNGGSPEAIMPLTRTSNGDLGVKAQVGASLNNVKVEVINQTREDVKVSNAAVRRNDGEWVISLVLNGVSKNVLGSRETLRGLLA